MDIAYLFTEPPVDWTLVLVDIPSSYITELLIDPQKNTEFTLYFNVHPKIQSKYRANQNKE